MLQRHTSTRWSPQHSTVRRGIEPLSVVRQTTRDTSRVTNHVGSRGFGQLGVPVLDSYVDNSGTLPTTTPPLRPRRTPTREPPIALCLQVVHSGELEFVARQRERPCQCHPSVSVKLSTQRPAQPCGETSFTGLASQCSDADVGPALVCAERNT